MHCKQLICGPTYAIMLPLLVNLSLLSPPLQATPPIDLLKSAGNNEYHIGSALHQALEEFDLKQNKDSPHFETVVSAWTEMEFRYKHHLAEKMNQSRPLIKQLLTEANISAKCRGSLLSWMSHLERLDLWSARMWNSWGNFPASGFFEGSFTDLGSYRSCLNIEKNSIIDEPQYCTLDFQPLLMTRPRFHSIFSRVVRVQGVGAQLESNIQQVHKLQSTSSSDQTKLNSTLLAELAKIAQYFYYVKLRIGSCWPSKCSSQDIQSISSAAASRLILQANPVFCVTQSENNKRTLNRYQMSSIVILISLASVTLLATVLHFFKIIALNLELGRLVYGLSFFDKFIDISSLQKNVPRLLSTTLPDTLKTKEALSTPKLLTCLNGLRIFFMVWIIYGHTLFNFDYQSYTHIFHILNRDLKSIYLLPSLNTNFSVDSFFLMSGLLNSYIIFSLNVRFNYLFYTAARYFRLTPQLLIVILFFFLLPIMGEGPIYKQATEQYANRCYKNFWLNLLHVQVYFDRPDMCMTISWWLSIEMTFYVLSLPVIYLLMKNQKRGLILNFGVACSFTLAGAFIHYSKGLSIQYLPSIPQRYEVEMEMTQLFFHRPYPHAASYFLGLALGYALAKKCINKLSKLQLKLGWLFCVISIATCLWGTYYWNQGAPYTQLQATIYYNLCQILWPCAISWIILVCTLGQGGVVDDILSANMFLPLGKINYMTYLSHIIVVYWYSASIHQTMEPGTLNLVYILIANTILSLGFATVLSLIYEAPLLNLKRMILTRKMISMSNLKKKKEQ